MIALILMAVIVIILAFLFIPLRFCGHGRLADTVSGEIELAWAGGLIATRWPLNTREKPKTSRRIDARFKPRERTEPPSTKPSQRIKNSPKKFRLSSVRPFLDKHVIRESILFLRQIWKSLKLRLDVVGEYGTDDPALTGYLAALIAVITDNHHGLQLCPQFDGAMLNLEGELRGRIIPALLIWDCSRFILRAPIRRIWWSILSEKVIKNKRRPVYV